MVNVTDRAKDRLKQLLETRGDDRSVGLRLEHTSSGQLGIFPDRERSDDQIVEHEGAPVLLIGQEIAQAVEDTTIDYEEGGPSPRLVIKKHR
jgi:Fe-S cluster assembly iron-binding protein IscA